MPQRHNVDPNRVVAESLDDEVMVVNLDTGYYYVIDGTGAVLWEWFAAGATHDETVAELGRRYAGDRADMAVAATDFLAQLVGEELLQPSLADDPVDLPDRRPPSDPRPAFTPPSMLRHTDMANLIQMDPIRDFDESRWPSRKSKRRPPSSS